VIAVHPQQGDDGECYYLDSPEYLKTVLREFPSYRQVFVANDSGKTIDRIVPSEFEPREAITEANPEV